MKKNGFTLIELLAVIAILGILVILALPNIINIYHSAKPKVLTENNMDDILKRLKEKRNGK